jgi:hypothetical protein
VSRPRPARGQWSGSGPESWREISELKPVAITAALGFERDDGRWFRRGILTKILLAVQDRVPPVETRSRFRKGKKCPRSARPKTREFSREVRSGLNLYLVQSSLGGGAAQGAWPGRERQRGKDEPRPAAWQGASRGRVERRPAAPQGRTAAGSVSPAGRASAGEGAVGIERRSEEGVSPV